MKNGRKGLNGPVVAATKAAALKQLSPSLFEGVKRKGKGAERKTFPAKPKDAVMQWKRWVGAKESEYVYIPKIAEAIGIISTEENRFNPGEVFEVLTDLTEPAATDDPQYEKENEMPEMKKTKNVANNDNESVTETTSSQQDKCFTLLVNNDGVTTPAAVFMDRADADDFKVTLELMSKNGAIPGEPSYEVFETLLRR